MVLVRAHKPTNKPISCMGQPLKWMGAPAGIHALQQAALLQRTVERVNPRIRMLQIGLTSRTSG